jgi:hypothetical protein
MRDNDIVWDEQRIKEHEGRKVAFAHEAAALVKEKAAIAKEKAAIEAYEAEYNQWFYLNAMGPERCWIHRDTLTEAINSDQYTGGSQRTTRLRGRHSKVHSQ